MRSLSIFALLLAVAVVPSTLSTQERPSLEQRVAELERRVTDLERALGKLSSPGVPSGQDDRVEEVPPWRLRETWRTQLKWGMTRDQVRAIMGEPDKIEAYSLGGDVWHYGYPGGGTISFDKNGVLRMWSEPRPDQLRRQ